MGLCKSKVYHDLEKGIDDKLLQYMNYAEQPDDEYKQLDTENDQKGDTAVEHIFKKTKTVYGQPPKDMKGIQLDWKIDYEIELKKRPCPYDFPAFQFDKPADYDEKKKEAEGAEDEKLPDKERTVSGRAKKDGEKKEKKDKKEDKNAKRSKSTPSKGKKKRTANNDMDECSLDDQ